jgi:hypothetical protein
MVVLATAGARLLALALFLCACTTHSFHLGRLHRSAQLRRFCTDGEAHTADSFPEVDAVRAVDEKTKAKDRAVALKERAFQNTLNGLLEEARANNVADGKGGPGGDDFEYSDLQQALATMKKMQTEGFDDETEEGASVPEWAPVPTPVQRDPAPTPTPATVSSREEEEEFTVEFFLSRVAMAAVATVVTTRVLSLFGIEV